MNYIKKSLLIFIMCLFPIFAWGADSKITNLGAISSVAADDPIAIVDVSEDPDITKKVSIGEFVALAYFADSSEADQGAAGSGRSVKDLVDLIGSNNATIVFIHHGSANTDYVFGTNETIPANITLSFQNGARISVSTAKTLTLETTSIIAKGSEEIFIGAGSYTFADGTEVGSFWFATFETAVTKIGSDNVRLTVSKASSIADNCTVNANTALSIPSKGRILTVANTKTLTINAPFDAGLYQMFSGDGSVVFGTKAVNQFYPEWWGTGDDVLIKAVAASPNYSTIKLQSWTTYTITKSFTLGGRNIIGTSPSLTTGGESEIKLSDGFTDSYAIEVNQFARLQDFCLNGNDKAARLLYLHNIQHPTYLAQLWLRNFSKAAIYIYRDAGGKTQDIHIVNVSCQPQNDITEPVMVVRNANELEFIGCMFYGNDDTGGQQDADVDIVEVSENSNGNKFIGCSITYAGINGYGLKLLKSNHTVIIGNTIESCGNGIGIIGADPEWAVGTQIWGNKIFQTGDITGGNPGHAIYVDKGIYSTIDHLGAYTQAGDIELTANSIYNRVSTAIVTVTDNGTKNIIENLNASSGNRVFSETVEADGIKINGLLQYGSAGSLTIATDAVTITKGYHSVVVEGGTGSGADSLSIASGGVEGNEMTLRAATSGANDQVTIANGTGIGRFILEGGVNFVMDHVDDSIMFLHNNTEWVETSRSDNS
jgi:hypothetical protein